MKMIGNKINTAVATPSETSLIESLDSNVYLASSLSELHKVLLTREEALAQGHDPEVISARQLEFIEELDGFSGMKVLEFLANCRIFNTDSFNNRMELVSENLPALMDEVETLALAGVALSDTTVENIREAVGGLLSNLLFVIFYGYELSSIKESLDKGEDYEIQAYILKYFETKSFDVEAIVEFFYQLSREYRPALAVFEKAPELEAEFHLKAGIYVEVFISHEEYLDMEVVTDVITEARPIETLVSEFEEKVKRKEKEKAAKLSH